MSDDKSLPLLEKLVWTARAVKDKSGKYNTNGVTYNITEDGFFFGSSSLRGRYLETLKKVFASDVAPNPEKTTCQIQCTFERRGPGN
ncbi:MAG: hypothetical protein AABX35_00115 [Nanoarchaeota archaeon]